MKIGVCFPTRSRPQFASLAFRSALATADSPKPFFFIRMDEDDPDAPGLKEFFIGLAQETGTTVQVQIGPHLRAGNVDYLNDAAQMAYEAGCDIIMQLDDDQEFLSRGWNTEIARVAGRIADGVGVLATEAVPGDFHFVRPPILTRRWYELQGGYFYPPVYTHFMGDTEVNDIAHFTNKFYLVPGVAIRHRKQKDGLAGEIRRPETVTSDTGWYIRRGPEKRRIAKRIISLTHPESHRQAFEMEQICEWAEKLGVPPEQLMVRRVSQEVIRPDANDARPPATTVPESGSAGTP